jgi:hypothetical protein
MPASFAIRNLLKDATLAALLVALVCIALSLKWVRPYQIYAKVHARVTVTLTMTLLAAVLLPVGWRMAVLPWRPIPEPIIHDEYAHLLVADTLAAGRLANPSHPLWQHFDTFYVLQHPAYASVYPIGQGAILAAGKILAGNPWFGAVFATSLMCGAIAWVLFELLPLGWVAAGLLPIAFTYGLQWVDGYWGGSFCAFGGAILCAALLRLRKAPSARMAIVASLGWAIVWLIRPYESLVLFVLLWGSIVVLAIRAGPAWKQWIAPIVMLVLVLGCAGAITLLHNHAATGSLITMPQRLDQQISGVPQSFGWQPAIPPPTFRFPEMREMYFWQLHQRQLTSAARAFSMAQMAWVFFVTPWFSLPLLLTLFVIRDRSVAVAWVLLACSALASLLYPFFFPHYIAAYSCVFAFLIVRGLMVLDGWSIHGRRVGRWLALFIILGGFFNEPLAITPLKDIVRGPAPLVVNSREYISERLKKIGGNHVAFVRYGINHDFHDEWVYNAADIDTATVIWCRWMGPRKDSEVMQYYPSRKFWIVDVDAGVGEMRVAKSVSRYQLQQ